MPWKTAIYYMLGVLVVFGGAGVWLPFFTPGKAVGVDALATFVMATVSPLVADLLMGTNEYGDRFDREKRALFILGFAASWGFAILSLIREGSEDSWVLGGVSTVISLLTWFFLKVRSENFMDETQTGPIGGPDVSVTNLGGSGL